MTGTWAEADARLQQRQQQRQWQAWRVLRVEQESRDIRSFYLQPPSDSAVGFAPGQHVPVQVKRDGEAPLIRTYSLSSAPSDGYWRISVKAQGPVSRHLHARIAPGDVLDVRPPMGSFTLDVQSTRPLVLIGAGVGITPLLAMLREQLSQGQARAIHVFQGARSLADLPFRQELASLQQRAEGLLHIHRALSQPESHALLGRDYEFAGRLGIGQVKATLALDDYEFYLCGPGSFTQDLYEGLRGVHVPDARIHAEAFGPSTLRRHPHADQPALQQPPAASEPVPVYFAASAKEALAGAGRGARAGAGVQLPGWLVWYLQDQTGEWPGALPASTGRATGGGVGVDLLCRAGAGAGGGAGPGAGHLIHQPASSRAAENTQMNNNPGTSCPQELAWTRST